MLSNREVADMVRHAYGWQRSALSYSDVVTPVQRRRLRWRRERWLPAVIAVAVLVLFAAIGLFAARTSHQPTPATTNHGVGPTASPDQSPGTVPAGADSDAFHAQCVQQWQKGDQQHHPVDFVGQKLPPTLFAFGGDSGPALRVFTDGENVFLCIRDQYGRFDQSIGRIGIVGQYEDLFTEVNLGYFAAISFNGPEVFYGTAPPTATRVLPESVSKPYQTALKSNHFVVWAPEGGLDQTSIYALNVNSVVAEGPPNVLIGDIHPATLIAACKPIVTRFLERKLPLIDAVTVTLRPLSTFGDSPNDTRVVIYATPAAMADCTLEGDGYHDSVDDSSYLSYGGELLAPAGSTLAPMSVLPGEMNDYQMYVVGVAPAGAASAEVSDATTTVPLQLSNNFFSGFWPPSPRGILDDYTVTVYGANHQVLGSRRL
jgi:hypothetical protein